MTRLDERLTHIEQRLDDIHRLLLRLLAHQSGTGTTLDPSMPASDQPMSQGETDAEIARLLSELGLAEGASAAVVSVDDDPQVIQYNVALNWAKQGRADDLSDFDLSGRNLRNVDLKDARLARANLSKSDLTTARMARADLSAADLSRGQLARADLTRATLTDANLSYTSLTYAKLEGAMLRHTDLTRANLTGANLTGADLGGANFTRANLARANLKNAAVTARQLAMASSLDGATMPDGRLFDGSTEPFKA